MSKERAKAYTFEEKFEMAVAIRQNGAKGDDGYWTYNEGWSDERISKEMDVPTSLVAATRQKIGGPLKRGGGTGPLANVFERLADLERKVQALEADMSKSAPAKANVAHDKLADLRQHFAKN